MATSEGQAQPRFAPPKVLTYPSSTLPELVTQGAEGRLYKTTYLLPSIPCALKYRPPKPYRHPTLDSRLTKARILAEARVLARCRRDGVHVPAVYCVDEAAGWLMMEWIDGPPIRKTINDWLGKATSSPEQTAPDRDHTALRQLMRRIGAAVGKLHGTGVIHGDLTTSNMLLQRTCSEQTTDGSTAGDKNHRLDGDVVLIDFGLATQGTATTDEDRAVDLYVLERAFGSTHPRAEPFFSEVLDAYKDSFKQAGPVLRKLEDVRQRGRKRSMLG